MTGEGCKSGFLHRIAIQISLKPNLGHGVRYRKCETGGAIIESHMRFTESTKFRCTINELGEVKLI